MPLSDYRHSINLEVALPTTMVFRPLVGQPASGHNDVCLPGAVNASGLEGSVGLGRRWVSPSDGTLAATGVPREGGRMDVECSSFPSLASCRKQICITLDHRQKKINRPRN
jgi:hypothetical protein